MAFFSGTSGERRRRVLGDTAASGESPRKRRASTGDDDSRESPAYNDTALDSQPKITAFVPQHYWSIALWFVAASLVVAGLATLHAYLPQMARVLGRKNLAAFDLTARGSLASWFTSLLVFSAVSASLVIYSVRRHKLDDYQGRYRVWLWTAAVLFGLSVNAVAPMHRMFADVMVFVTGWGGWADGVLWWLAPAAVLLASVGLRLMVEVRRCPPAVVSLVAAVAAWAAALLATLDWLPLPQGELAVIVANASRMGGDVFLLTALALYARHVVLDAGGKVAIRPRKLKKPKPVEIPAENESSDESARSSRTRRSSSGGQTRTDSAHEPTSRRSKRRTPAPSNDAWVDGSDQVDDPYENDESVPTRRRLSKAERRRLRKQKAQQQGAEA